MLRIYNSLTKKKEPFRTVESGIVKIYVCGPTVYDACHIGHARSVVVFDVIVRYLRAVGYTVNYVRNFTDIDDKIIHRAKEKGLTTRQLAEKYIREFYDDMDALKVQRATKEPRATEHIPEIIRVVQRLFEQGHAYEVDGDVFFSVDTFADYGKLSGRRLEDMQAGARVEIDKRKRNPFDFVLWKRAKPGEPTWDSPWGKGRPGWHIECSAMSTHFLGEQIDIHGGGEDLRFPHHENEIAQSEGAFGKSFVTYWVHNGFVQIDHEKMSKSLGNFLLIKDILRRFHPEAVRLFLLSNHYRSPVDFTDQAMREAETGLEKIYTFLDRIARVAGPIEENSGNGGSDELWEKFREAMNDDFNTAKAIGHIFEAMRQANRLLDDMAEDGNQRNGKKLESVFADVVMAGKILGIGTEDPASYFQEKKSKTLAKETVEEALVEKLIGERTQARRDKDWSKADRIRDQLESMNVVLEDRPEGTVWKTKG
jgi:cysteinyl-tRNA synthetase